MKLEETLNEETKMTFWERQAWGERMNARVDRDIERVMELKNPYSAEKVDNPY